MLNYSKTVTPRRRFSFALRSGNADGVGRYYNPYLCVVRLATSIPPRKKQALARPLQKHTRRRSTQLSKGESSFAPSPLKLWAPSALRRDRRKAQVALRGTWRANTSVYGNCGRRTDRKLCSHYWGSLSLSLNTLSAALILYQLSLTPITFFMFNYWRSDVPTVYYWPEL